MSLSTALKQIKHINQSKKDIVFGYIRESQQLLPKNNAYYTIVPLIKYLCILYYQHYIDSTILSDHDKNVFIDLLDKHNKFNDLGDNYSWNLICKASDYKFRAKKIKEKVYSYKNLVIIIQSQRNNIFGGYTATGWPNRGDEYLRDPKAFLFSIKSNGFDAQIFNIKKRYAEYATYRHTNEDYMFMFGKMGRIDLHVCDKCNNSKTYKNRFGKGYAYDIKEKDCLNGDIDYFFVREIEIFELKTTNHKNKK